MAKKATKKTARKRTRRRQVGEFPADLTGFGETANKLHGEGTVLLGANTPKANHISTGCFLLDLALLGGFAQGYISMVYGYESSGKSTTLLRAVKNYQEKHPDKYVGWLDAEGMYDPLWAEKNGVDNDRIALSQPDYGELGVDIFQSLMEQGSIGMIVLDSIPHMVPHKVLENATEDETMAALARLMSKFCSKITMANNKERKKGHWITVLLVNQFRNKVGFVMGDNRTLPGGFQINHIPTTKVELQKKKAEMGKDQYDTAVAEFESCGFKLTKVKHGQSIRSGEYQMYLNPDNEEGLGEGEIDNYSPVVVYGKRMGFISGGGATWRLLTGGDGCPERFSKLADIKAYLKDNREEYNTLAKSIIAEQRRIKGQSPLPPDGFLVSADARYVKLADVKS